MTRCAASDAFMDALNGGRSTGRGYAAVARARVAVGDGPAPSSARKTSRRRTRSASALATIDIAASAIVAGTDQTGRIRGNRHNEVDLIQALEDDVTDPSDRAECDGRRWTRSVRPALIRARQQETRVELLTALTEQLLVDSKRDRDTEAAAMNMQLGRLTRGRAVAGESAGGLGGGLPDVAQPERLNPITRIQDESPCLQNHARDDRHRAAGHHEPADDVRAAVPDVRAEHLSRRSRVILIVWHGVKMMFTQQTVQHRRSTCSSSRSSCCSSRSAMP